MISTKINQLEEYIQHNSKKDQSKVYWLKFYQLFFIRFFLEFCITAAFIYVGYNFIIQSQFSLNLWPAPGVALTVLFLRGYLPAVAIYIGTFFAFYQNDFSLLFSNLQAIGFCSFVLATRYLTLRLIDPIQPVHKSYSLLAFISIVLPLSFCHCALNFIFFKSTDYIWPHSFMDLCWQSLAQFNGIVCLTPLTLMLDPYAIKSYFSKRWTNIIWWLGLLLVFLMLATVGVLDYLEMSLYSAILGISIIAVFALIFGQIPAALLLLTVAVCALGGLFDDNPHPPYINHKVIMTLSLISSLSLVISCWFEKIHIWRLFRQTPT